MDLNRINDLIEYIKEERKYQERKWGGEEHDAEHDLYEWLKIMVREINEAGDAWITGRTDHAKQELVQALAVGFAALEQYEPIPARYEN